MVRLMTGQLTVRMTQQSDMNPVVPATGARPVLVTGGTGKTGGRVAAALTRAGVPVRIGSRSGGTHFDWEDRDTWAPALRGAAAAYLAYYPDITDPGAAAVIRAFAEEAVAHGVRRLVLLSARGADAALPAERAVAVPGAEWTVIRAAWFFQNFDEGLLRDGVLGGEVVFPAGDVKEPFVDAEDIAEVAVAALTGEGHAGRVHELTGPRLLTFAEAAAELTAVTGRPVRYLPVSGTEYGEALAGYGLPPELVAFLTELFTTLLDGRNAHLADGVQRVLGRAPRDFTDFAREGAARGAWAV